VNQVRFILIKVMFPEEETAAARLRIYGSKAKDCL
jgi:hypothetical protein